MSPHRFSLSITILLANLLIFYPFEFTQEAPVSTPSVELKPGVVVEEIKKNWGAGQAGLQPEDILVERSRGDDKGKIE